MAGRAGWVTAQNQYNYLISIVIEEWSDLGSFMH